jgi:hypothetical protein
LKLVIKYCFLLFVMLGAGNTLLFAQEMDPEIQKMTEEVLKWTQAQFQKNGTIDQHKLDSMNQRIRDRQAELNAQKQTNKVSADTLSGKIINVAMFQGNQIVVPAGKIWRVKSVICQTGVGEYSVLVTSVKFKEKYLAGETITMPAFTPEASLLTEDMSSITYNFKIIETEN